MVLDRYLVAKGLMGTLEIVFDQPLGHLSIEGIAVGTHVAQLEKFPLDGAIEPFVHGIVFGRSRTRMVMRQRKFCSCLPEIFCKLAAIVRLEILDLRIKQVIDPLQEISRMVRPVPRIHPRKGDFRVDVDPREDISLESGRMPHDGVECHEKSRTLLLLELRDAFFGLVLLTFLGKLLVLRRMEIQLMLFDHSLDFPRRDGRAIFLPVQNPELHLAPADVGATQTQDAELFNS